jgi:hypothetical protein
MSKLDAAMIIERPDLPQEVREFLDPIFGKLCCRQRVSKPKALHFGFGEKIYHGNPKLADEYYGEWEIGTYYCGWRVSKDGKILCGSDDLVESPNEMDAALNRIEFGALNLIQQLSNFDVRVGFDTGVVVDFLATTSDEADACLEIICESSHRAAEFTVGSGWIVGDSNSPWRR